MSDPKEEFAAAVADARTEGQDEREAAAKREHEERLEFVRAQQRMAAEAHLATLCVQNPVVTELVKERDELKKVVNSAMNTAEELDAANRTLVEAREHCAALKAEVEAVARQRDAIAAERDALKAQLSALAEKPEGEEPEPEPATDTGAKRRSRKSTE